MPQLLAYSPTEDAARATIEKLVSMGFSRNIFTVNDSEDETGLSSVTKIVIVIGLGALAAYLVPSRSILQLSYHPALHMIGLMSVRMLAGAATGGAVDFLFRVAKAPQRDVPASGRYSIVADVDWQTAQSMQLALSRRQEEIERRLKSFVERFGYEHQSFLSLYGGSEVWFGQEVESAVVYRKSGRVAVVTAAPLAAQDNLKAATDEFLRYCDATNMDCLMLPIGSHYADIASSCGMARVRIGESGYFSLPTWKPAGDKAKKVRAGVNQARQAGVFVSKLDPEKDLDGVTREGIEALCADWIKTREVDAFSWLLELNPFKLSEYKRYFVARNGEGNVVGFLSCSPIPARKGWYLEDLIRRPEGERGISELLVVEALKHLSAEGAELATLATSPLAGVKDAQEFRVITRILHLIYEHFDAFYHFKLLHRFKAKFAPSFNDAEYLAFYPPKVRPRMIRGAINVIEPGGLTGMAASKLRKVRERWLKPQA